MTEKQLAILNSLVTFAAENVPGGLSDDEREVAQIVGNWVLNDKKYEYETVNVTLFSSTQEAANEYASMGWRVVAGLGSQGPGYADVIIVERPVGTNIFNKA